MHGPAAVVWIRRSWDSSFHLCREDRGWRDEVRRSASGAPSGALVENGPDEIEAGSRGEQRGDAAGIVGGRDLDKIGADENEPFANLAQKVLALIVGEAAMADSGGSRRDRRIEAVDVDRDIDPLAVGNVRERCGRALGPEPAQ